jgi:DNA-binding PadR family transcriptional regulator
LRGTTNGGILPQVIPPHVIVDMESGADMPDPLPLSVPVYQILLSLAAEDSYGYALIRDIRERTEGEVDLTASTLYGALQRMLEEGWIVETGGGAESEGPRRRVYAITLQGRRVVTEEAQRLQRAVRHAMDAHLLDTDGLRTRIL